MVSHIGKVIVPDNFDDDLVFVLSDQVKIFRVVLISPQLTRLVAGTRVLMHRYYELFIFGKLGPQPENLPFSLAILQRRNVRFGKVLRIESQNDQIFCQVHTIKATIEEGSFQLLAFK